MEISANQQACVWPSEWKWSDYESYVSGYLEREIPGAIVQRNVKISGTKTGRPRQVDVLVERNLGPLALKIAIDCKCYGRKVNVKDVESFLGMLDDIRVSKGVLVTTKGYTKTAHLRIERESRDIELRVLTPDRLSDFQHMGDAVLWHEPVAAIVSSPEGWVLDNQDSDPQQMQFAMYPLAVAADVPVTVM